MNQASDETPRTAIRLGKTTYLVGMHFKEDGKETMNDKMIRMIREDVQSGNF
ncbi:MAG: transposon-encoded TnpW family protein [Lachnospiraceae bacterium]|nr:transposon-encoded TnpW family protein [Lachnospiraceae bacterium]